MIGIDNKIFELSCHPELKVFGSFFNVAERCDEFSKENGWIVTYPSGKDVQKIPGVNLTICNENEIEVYFPKAREMLEGIVEIKNKWDVRNLIKQGYQRV